MGESACGLPGSASPCAQAPKLTLTHIRSKKGAVSLFIKISGRQFQNSPRGVFLAGTEATIIQFEKENSYHKAGALIAVNKGMVANNAGRVVGRHIDKVWRGGVSESLLSPCKR